MVSHPSPRRRVVADAVVAPRPLEVVTIDCRSCSAHPSACADCVVAVLLPEAPDTAPALDADERRALSILSDSGLVPPLRYEPPTAR